MAKYTKRPITIEAMQFTGENFGDLEYFCGMHRDSGDQWDIKTFNPIGTYLIMSVTKAFEMNVKAELWVAANSQWLPIVVDEWIIKDSLGFYPCKDRIFKATYDQNENQ